MGDFLVEHEIFWWEHGRGREQAVFQNALSLREKRSGTNAERAKHGCAWLSRRKDRRFSWF